MSPELEVMQVIRTRILVRGKGVEDDPVRIVEQYWTMDGRIIFEIDPENGCNHE